MDYNIPLSNPRSVYEIAKYVNTVCIGISYIYGKNNNENVLNNFWTYGVSAKDFQKINQYLTSEGYVLHPIILEVLLKINECFYLFGRAVSKETARTT